MRSKAAARPRHRVSGRIRTVGKPILRLTYRRTLAFVPHRLELGEVLNRRGLVGVSAEVGVFQGEFSSHLLESWGGRRLLSIDPWDVEHDPGPPDAEITQLSHDRFLATARARLAQFGERSSIWRMTSADAASRISPGALDFVYIDARHELQYVREDLRLWFDRVRPGGLFAGHDYVDTCWRGISFRVKTAVDEFCAERGLRVWVTRLDGPCFTWLIVVPHRDAG